MVTNPIAQSEIKIRDKVLQEIPLGTQMESVIQLIKNKNDWVLSGIYPNHGFTHKGTLDREEIGVKSVEVYLGDYRFFTNLYLATDVTVFFGFNEKSELIDIFVWKVIDGL
ncbi:hypothetical protein ACFQ88_23140 [Paenibacillus sp. NPDC056579]|uniref:hypothetical protein n=1 Tax=Paenibacillus sp. NPDC056579 TaxID=3345871 RepID=UPI00368770C2